VVPPMRRTATHGARMLCSSARVSLNRSCAIAGISSTAVRSRVPPAAASIKPGFWCARGFSRRSNLHRRQHRGGTDKTWLGLSTSCRTRDSASTSPRRRPWRACRPPRRGRKGIRPAVYCLHRRVSKVSSLSPLPHGSNRTSFDDTEGRRLSRDRRSYLPASFAQVRGDPCWSRRSRRISGSASKRSCW
jgi:hypothetical protein